MSAVSPYLLRYRVHKVGILHIRILILFALLFNILISHYDW